MGDYALPIIQARLAVVANAINAGSGPGQILLGTAGMATTILAVPFDDPCGTPAGDLLTFTGMPKTAAATAGGTIATASLVDSTGAVVRSNMSVGLVGTGTYEVTIDALTVAIGQSVTILSAYIRGK